MVYVAVCAGIAVRPFKPPPVTAESAVTLVCSASTAALISTSEGMSATGWPGVPGGVSGPAPRADSVSAAIKVPPKRMDVVLFMMDRSCVSRDMAGGHLGSH